MATEKVSSYNKVKIDNGINMDLSDFIHQFDQLVSNTKELCTSLKQSSSNLWVPVTLEESQLGITPAQKACNGFQDFWYQDGQDGRETRSCFGLIPATDQQIDLALQINELKAIFKTSIKQLQKNHKEHWLELKGKLAVTHPSLREQLHYSGLSRLHIKQTWRHIPVIDRTPIRAGFNWYQSGRSIQKMTVQQAQDALLRLDTSGNHIQTQLSLLSKLPSNTPLAKVQNLAPVMRANLFYDDAKFPNRQAMNVSLPILYKASLDGKIPPHNDPLFDAPSIRERKVRSDRVIEDEPYLPSIRVHRYLNT